VRPRCVRESAGGWTLVELTIVISLITVLSTLALVGYRSAITRSREAVLKENLFRMRDAIDQFYADREAYPRSLDELVTEGYIRAVPEDPFTGTADRWQTIPVETTPDDPFAEGVYDVRSSSEELALDGSAYADW